MTSEPGPRRFDPPGGISDAARDALAALEQMVVPDIPVEDHQAWSAWITEQDEGTASAYPESAAVEAGLRREPASFGGVPGNVLVPQDLEDPDAAPVVVEVHGGGLVFCGGDLSWRVSVTWAKSRDAVTWVPDYRMPPKHPYPAALDDCVATYRAALSVRPPEQILVSGVSAGGNLAAALMLRIKAEGLPMPAGLILVTPEVDLTESGDSFRTNDGLCRLASLTALNRLYAGTEHLADPYLSPLFGDLTGFPPTLLTTGTRDLFLSNTVRMHRVLLAAGVPAELHVFEAMPHGSFTGSTPEDLDLQATLLAFERRQLAR